MVEAHELLQNRDFMLLWAAARSSRRSARCLSHVIFPLLILAITRYRATAAGARGGAALVRTLPPRLPVGALIGPMGPQAGDGV
jgi:hypothetical protein